MQTCLLQLDIPVFYPNQRRKGFFQGIHKNHPLGQSLDKAERIYLNIYMVRFFLWYCGKLKVMRGRLKIRRHIS